MCRLYHQTAMPRYAQYEEPSNHKRYGKYRIFYAKKQCVRGIKTFLCKLNEKHRQNQKVEFETKSNTE
jgi:hypothetical protein